MKSSFAVSFLLPLCVCLGWGLVPFSQQVAQPPTAGEAQTALASVDARSVDREKLVAKLSTTRFAECRIEAERDNAVLELRRNSDGTLDVFAQVDRVIEMGPFSTGGIRNKTLEIGYLAHCGTISSHTIGTVPFRKTLTKDEELTIERIQIYGHITLEKTGEAKRWRKWNEL